MTGFIIKVVLGVCVFSVGIWWGSTYSFAATIDVSIDNKGRFDPDDITINTGDTVRWTATDDGEQVSSDNHPSHTLYPDPACPNASCWDSTLLFTDDTFSFTFHIGGIWEYHNHQSPGRSGSITVTDLNAPAVTSDLASSNATASTIDLSWTSPGDDVGNTGNYLTPTTYDIRYSTSTIIEGNWASATTVTGEPTPLVVGSAHSMTVTSLSSSTTYYFAMKTSDEVPNESAISNVISLATSAPSGDTTPPAAITDLSASNATLSSIDLTWTAPGDDENTGTAQSYDIRYSTSTITEGNWASATTVTGEPTPLIAGSSQSITITELSSATTYYFAMKTSDEEPNVSGLSNVPSLSTLSSSGGSGGGGGTGQSIENTAPAAVTDFIASNPTTFSVELTWTAPGDDGESGGNASLYDIRYSILEITDINWFHVTTQVVGEPTPSSPGTQESMTVEDLSPGTLNYFAMRTSDEVPNVSELSNVVPISTIVPDNTDPGLINDLTFREATISAVELTWTASGDDEYMGTAASYDIRYMEDKSLTDENWDMAISFLDPPIPEEAGSSQSWTIVGLSHETTYSIAIKTSDEVENQSEFSNVITFTTLALPEEGPVLPEEGEGEQISVIPEEILARLAQDTLVRVEGETKVYAVRDEKKLWIPTLELFIQAGYDWNDVQEVSSSELFSFESRDLLRVESTPEVYVISGDKRRHILSPEGFEAEGYIWGDIANVTSVEGAWYIETNLLRANDDTKIYLIKDDTKTWIQSEEVFLDQGYGWSDVFEVSSLVLDGYTTIEPL